MKYKNFKEYQQSDEYYFRLLSGTIYQVPCRIEFQNGTFYEVIEQTERWGRFAPYPTTWYSVEILQTDYSFLEKLNEI